MGVPEEIRKVKRPINTVVSDNKKDGPHRWAVRERAFVMYVPGKKNPQPHLGKTIGYIVDGKYVSIEDENRKESVADNLQYGAGTFVKTVVDDIKEDLMQVFPIPTALTILAVATLRVINPKVADKNLNYEYNKSVVSLHYPGIFLSAKSVHNLYEDIGCNIERRGKFSLRRLERIVAEHHIAIDGMLKQDNSSVNNLGAFTDRSRVKNQKEISILYALDLDDGEIICGEVFPGNFVDLNAYAPFIEHNHITKGIIIDDKGFPPSKIRKVIKNNPNLHFITPIKRNDKRITQHEMSKVEGVIMKAEGPVFYKKKQIGPDRFLYSFKDPDIERNEKVQVGKKAWQDQEFDADKFASKENTCGLITFESDVDLLPEIIYRSYKERWKIEMVFREYKTDLDLDITRVHGDFTVIGSEFVNLISSMITTRLLKKMKESGLFEEYSYDTIMERLKDAWRIIDAPKPVVRDSYWVHTKISDFKVLEKLGLAAPDPLEELKYSKETMQSKKSTKTNKKVKGNSNNDSRLETTNSSTEKRKPGRPRIHPQKDPSAPKRPVGRPRIHQPKDPNAPKRGRGRPRKNDTAYMSTASNLE